MGIRSSLAVCGGICRRIAAVASTALAFLASPAHAEPAMWVVKDSDSTIYLLGTFHLAKPGLQWRSDKIEAALKNSGELWVEASESGNEALLETLLLKHGFDPARPLSTKLSGEAWDRLQSAAKLVGMPVSSVDQMRPWLAATYLTLARVMQEGYDPYDGPDRELENSARAAQKTVKTLESLEQHMLVFSAISEQGEIDFLMQTLGELEGGPKFSDFVDQMAAAWVAGDTGKLETMTLGKLKADAPELYESVLIRRNLDWSDQISAIMRGAGTSFVAVGAAHLIGSQSVPAILAERGFMVTPY
jgi:uncharacterized protein